LVTFTRCLQLTLLALFWASSAVFAQRETVDKIVAVVGDQVILASELAGQIQFTALQSGRQPRSEREVEELRNEVLNQMISDQLFLVAARHDTTISVRDDDVEMALDERVATISKNFPTEQAFLDALAAEGITLRELRKRFKSEVKNQILKQRFIQKKLSSVSISRHEVEQFYNEFRDSIPVQPEAARLAHVLLGIQPSTEIEDSIKQRTTQLRQEILNGADFADMSREHSSLGAGADGGDLGWISREDVVDEFARAAFQLQVGDISGVVRSPFGYHVIKCEGKRDDKLKLRHLLLAVAPSVEDTGRVLQLADSLLQSLREGASFEETAKIFSADNETRAQGGELGWFALSNLPPEFALAVTGWKTPGEYRGPVTSQYGVHLFKLLEYQAEKEYTLEDDFDSLKELARQDKTGRLVDKWIEQIKAQTHIENRLDAD
jgi:peptidyl-prolyl cis-trans isomerase SurA